MLPDSYSYVPVTALATGLASAVTLATAATLAANAPTDGMAHQVTVTGLAATNHSAKTITVVGTDADGNALTDTMAGPNGAVTVTTTEYFKTVTSVSISATAGADTFNIGWAAPSVTKTVPVDWRANVFNLGLEVNISGTINYTVQYLMEDPFRSTVPPARTTVGWINCASPLAGATADQAGAQTIRCRAVRFIVTSVTNGATAIFSIIPT